MDCRVGQASWAVVAKYEGEVKTRHDEGQHRDGLRLQPLRFPNRPYEVDNSDCHADSK